MPTGEDVMPSLQPIHDVRPSPIANEWYPGDPIDLANSVDAYIEHADIPPIEGRVVGILAPHAGHRYSGPVAGYAFKFLRGLTFDVVALVGPSHYRYPARVLTSSHDAYETPLGRVPVDRDTLGVLREKVSIDAVREDPEHSLEIELPFLQRTLGEFSLIPLAMIDQSLEMAEQLGHALAEVLKGKKALLVASSDLSHFHQQNVANRLDQKVLDAVNAYDPAGVIQAKEFGQEIACGRGAIATVMIAARDLGADSAAVVHHATSGDVIRRYDRVVGYGAAVFYQKAVT
jgi:AmmeMemoRadiSam system protein B